MVFYCPNCRQEYTVEPATSATTQMGRLAYKAPCPSCGQEMVEFLPTPPAPLGSTESRDSGTAAAPTPPLSSPAPVAPVSTPTKPDTSTPASANGQAESVVAAFLQGTEAPVPTVDSTTTPPLQVNVAGETDAQSLLNEAAQAVKIAPVANVEPETV